MDRRSSTAGRRLTLLVAAGVFIALGGCAAASIQSHGSSHTLAIYSSGSLRAHLSRGVDVMTAAAAGEAALIERGYVIVRREGTQGRMTLRGATPDAGRRRHFARSVVFRAFQRNRGVRIEIQMDPLPNEAESRAILDATFAHLGR